MPFDHFNFIAKIYARAGQYRPSEPMLGLLSLSPRNVLLDVGGGTGRVAVALRSLVQEVFVVDTAPVMLRFAADKGLAAIYAPAESLPFPSGSIDRILMMDALHHVLDQRTTARELWRVLAPGGRILIVEPDIRKLSVKLIALGEKVLLMRSHFLSDGEITSLFRVPDVKAGVFFDKFNIFFLAEKVRKF